MMEDAPAAVFARLLCAGEYGNLLNLVEHPIGENSVVMSVAKTGPELAVNKPAIPRTARSCFLVLYSPLLVDC